MFAYGGVNISGLHCLSSNSQIPSGQFYQKEWEKENSIKEPSERKKKEEGKREKREKILGGRF